MRAKGVFINDGRFTVYCAIAVATAPAMHGRRLAGFKTTRGVI